MPNKPRVQKQRKIALLGYRSVGKSSLAIQYVEKRFPGTYDPTIEQTYTKTITVRGNEYYLRILDTAGQDEFSIFSPNYAIDVHGYCLVYSIESRKSFEVVQAIYDKLMETAGGVKFHFVLVGNKTDLSADRVVSAEEGKKLAEQWGAAFIELSAKQNTVVTDLFENLIVEIDKLNSTETKANDKCSLM